LIAELTPNQILPVSSYPFLEEKYRTEKTHFAKKWFHKIKFTMNWFSQTSLSLHTYEVHKTQLPSLTLLLFLFLFLYF